MPDHRFDLLTLFFPMWNEEDTIQQTVAAACEEGDRLIELGETHDYEVLLVDDASADSRVPSPTGSRETTPVSESCTTPRTGSSAGP